MNLDKKDKDYFLHINLINKAPIKILIQKMAQSHNQIKITCFKQLRFDQPNQSKKPQRGQYLLNFIIYSPMKSLKFLDPCLRELNQNNQLFIVKCNNMSNLGYSLQSCKVGVKTILIIDKEIEEQAIKDIISNQQLMKNKDNFTCWIFTNEIQNVKSSWFHAAEVSIITSSQQKMIQMLKKQYENIHSKLNSYNSATTIQSTDKINMDIKLQIHSSPEKKILGEQNFYSKNQSALNNGVPHVGTYNIRKQNSWMETKGHHFQRSK